MLIGLIKFIVINIWHIGYFLMNVVECLIFDDCSLINMAKLEYLCCVFQFSAIHQHKGTIWYYQKGGFFLGYVAAQWWSKNWMSASLWPGKIGGSCLSLLIGMQHPQSLETTFVCKVHCSQPGSQTVWQKFANDCCHIYKCMLQSVSLHQSEQLVCNGSLSNGGFDSICCILVLL